MERFKKSNFNLRFLAGILLVSFLEMPLAQAEELKARGLFVSMVQDPPAYQGHRAVRRLIKTVKKFGVETLFVQVYRAGPTKSQLGFLIREAHAECMPG